MATELNKLALGYAAATVAATGMLVLGILGKLNIYTGAVSMMQQWHVFFSLSLGGILAGMVEAGVISFIAAYYFAAVYIKFA